jgi:hypothetical protein
MAVAAGALLFVGRDASTPMDRVTVAAAPSAGTLVSSDGEVLVAGRPVLVGATVSQGDAIEARGGRAVFERKVAGKLAVTYAVEPGARALAKKTTGALVLELQRGAVEAKVVPVEAGEAFAVDVGPTRVAVHGTHLRVAHDEGRATVDLSEGVVAIGDPPKVGTTQGELVNAPAHVEFVPTDVKGSIKIDHAPASVRPAMSFAMHDPAPPAPSVPQEPPAPARDDKPATPAPVATHKVEPPHKPAALPTVDPEGQILRAVNACLAARPPGQDVTMRVHTVVNMTVNEEGHVEMTRFEPPLAPAVQECAAATIYKVKFARSGSVQVTVDYQK